MHRRRVLVRLAWAAVAAPLAAACAADGTPSIGGILRDLGQPRGEPLTEDRIAAGLREALRVGTEHAVAATGRRDGFFGDPRIRIPIPASFETVERRLRQVGLGAQVDAFELSMNRAAERAAPSAKRIFWDAVAGVTIDDARRILRGGDTAATDLFRARTREPLAAAFRPVVGDALAEVGVTRQYRDLVAAYNRIPLAARPAAVDLDAYVTGRALDGLFLMVAEEERRIRTDPAARATALLREVFGSRQSAR